MKLDIYNPAYGGDLIFDRTIDVKLKSYDVEEPKRGNYAIAEAFFVDPRAKHGEYDFVVSMVCKKEGDFYKPVKLAGYEVEVREPERA